MPRAPKISVLFPVHNARPFLFEALDSLAAQTFTDFEVIAVDDGSADGSGEDLAEAARRWPWLRVVRQPHSGVANALNRAAVEGRGEFFARMDADDVAHPRRFERQMDFMIRTPTVGLCGSAFRVVGGILPSVVHVPEEDAAIRARLVFGSPFAHPTVLFRKGVVEALRELYRDPGDEGAQDYDLWIRMGSVTRMHNLSEVLLDYRRHPAQVTITRPRKTRLARVQSIRMDLLRQLGIDCNETEIVAHMACGTEEAGICTVTMPQVESWLKRLILEVPRSGWCDEATFRRECQDAWWRGVPRTQVQKGKIWGFLRSSLTPFSLHSLWQALRLARSRLGLPHG